MSADESQGQRPPEFGYLQSDEPIRRRADDRLNRSHLAEAIADQVIHSPPNQGFVIAIDGPWGSGKTSVLNMIEEVVAERGDTIALRFNPWLFSGTEELVVRFLSELGAQLGEKGRLRDDPRLRAAAETLASYGAALEPLAWVPVIGAWVARFGSVAKFAERRAKEMQETSALSQRNKVIEALSDLQRRVLVIVDDLDRIEPEQIRDVVRLIKLVGDFPNATYLLAYDSDKIARALGKDVAAGRDYLEKIVQVTHDLPAINDWALVQLLQTELDAAIQRIHHGPFSETDWVNIFHTGIRPFFTTVRDVRRYLNAAPVTLRVVGDEVALVDALALETLRIFAPAAYAKLPSLVSTLTAEGVALMSGVDRRREEADQVAVNDFVETATPHQEATKEILRRLFPRVGHFVGGTAIYGDERAYQIKRRVADPDVLRIYLRRTLPVGVLPARLVAEAYGVMGDRQRFVDLLENTEPEVLEDLLGRLLAYQDEYAPAAAEAATEVLLNQLPRLPERTRGMLDFEGKFAVTRVVYRALERVDDELERLEIVKRVLPRVVQLSGREKLIDLVGHRENVGHRLIPEGDAAELYRQHHEEVLAATPAALAQERQLISLFFRALEDETEETRQHVNELCEDDAVFLRLLRSALGEMRTQGMGDVYVSYTPQLPWDGLAQMVGSRERLEQRVIEFAERVDRAELDERTSFALETAERYVSGELPGRDQ